MNNEIILGSGERRPLKLLQTRQQGGLAILALLGAGFLLAVTTNLAKVAHGIGVSPIAYLTWSLCGAAVFLTTVSGLRGRLGKVNRRTVEYYLIAGFLTTAVSNLIFFSAVAHLGVSFIALMFSLPPVLTYALALGMKMERFCYWRSLGVILALAGTALLVTSRWSAPDVQAKWIALALTGPVLIALGNIYRTRRWPSGANVESLAPGLLIGAVVILIFVARLFDWSLSIAVSHTHVLSLILLQACVFAGQFLLLFVLQKAGGPVFLSLMGGVSALIGVPIAMVFLAEPLPPMFGLSAALLAAGIAAMLFGVKTSSA
jgi:drug/metabolite transporter (DMT)-like permease